MRTLSKLSLMHLTKPGWRDSCATNGRCRDKLRRITVPHGIPPALLVIKLVQDMENTWRGSQMFPDQQGSLRTG